MPVTVLPRTLFLGEHAVDALERLVDELDAKRVLIVSDPVVSTLPFFDEIVAALKKRVESLEIFSDVEQEPGVETARRVAEAARRINADLIVAVGGGSVIDAAKAGWLLYERPDVNPEEVNPFTRYGLGRKARLVAIPTTSGTGSDVSFGVVLTVERDGKRKLAMANLELVPYATILDADIVKGLPRHLTLYTAVDALSHAVEAYAAVNANHFSDALAEKAVVLIFKYLPRVLENPGNEEARLALHVAATMAGMAFTASGLGLAHAIAHALGPELGLHHGLAVGLTLPYVVEFNAAKSTYASARYEVLKRLLELHGAEAKPNLQTHIRELYEATGFPQRIRDLPEPPSRNEWEKAVRRIAERSLEDPELAFNPVPVSIDDVVNILTRMY